MDVKPTCYDSLLDSYKVSPLPIFILIQGDSGGPIMVSNKGTWELFGVTSFGLVGKTCGASNGMPGVYARANGMSVWLYLAYDLSLDNQQTFLTYLLPTISAARKWILSVIGKDCPRG